MRSVLIALLALAVVPAVADARPKAKKGKTPPAPVPAVEPEIDMAPEPALPPEPQATPAPEADLHDVAEPPPVAKKKKSGKSFYFRGGIAHIAPLSSSRPLELADVDGAASLAVQNGPIAGSGSEVSSTTIPAITVGYKLPFGGDHLSLETVLGVPFTVKFRATGTLANESIAPMALGIPTGVPPLGSELGEAKAAPPMITLVYNAMPHGKVQPFFGIGAAVLIAYNEKVTNKQLTAVSQPEMSIAPAPGLVFQAGLEGKIYKGLYARLDVKFIAFMLARAEVRHIQVETPELPLFQTVEVGTAKMSVWVNPLIIQGGLGLDF